jgi:hypothetical protein
VGADQRGCALRHGRGRRLSKAQHACVPRLVPEDKRAEIRIDGEDGAAFIGGCS